MKCWMQKVFHISNVLEFEDDLQKLDVEQCSGCLLGLHWGMVWQRLSFATATSDIGLKAVDVEITDSIDEDS